MPGQTGIALALEGQFVFYNHTARILLGADTDTFPWNAIPWLPPWPVVAQSGPHMVFPYTHAGYEIQFHHQASWVLIEARSVPPTHSEHIPAPWVAALLHEVRTPLATLSGYLELLDPQIREESAKQRLRRAQAEVVRLSHLTADLLGLFSRNISKEWCDINALVDQAEASIHRPGSPSPFTMDIASPHVRLYVNPERFILILTNLFKNAVEAVPAGAPLHLRVDIHQEARAYLVVVEDDGPGIPEEVLAQLATGPSTTKPQGHGWGLWIVNHLLDAQGGRLHIATHPHQGTTVTMAVPPPPKHHSRSSQCPRTFHPCLSSPV